MSDAEAEDMQLATVDDARLPANYEAARTALAACVDIDQCFEWAKKTEALASYARQAKDDSLKQHAMRIQARAIRRCGELLKELPAKAGRPGNIPNNGGGGAGAHLPVFSERAAAATAAGLSVAQRKDAIRVANVPESEFEESVESDKPPTIEALAERGKRKQAAPLVDLQGRDPREFNRSLHINGAVRQLREFIADTTPEEFVRGGLPRHYEEFKENSQPLMVWLERVSALLKKDKK